MSGVSGADLLICFEEDSNSLLSQGKRRESVAARYKEQEEKEATKAVVSLLDTPSELTPAPPPIPFLFPVEGDLPDDVDPDYVVVISTRNKGNARDSLYGGMIQSPRPARGKEPVELVEGSGSNRDSDSEQVPSSYPNPNPTNPNPNPNLNPNPNQVHLARPRPHEP